MDLYGLKYNNYFNRIIKKENDAIGYFNAATLKATQFNVSFNPNDGVTTTQIVNNGPEQHWEECDYVIITEKQTSSVNIQFVNALEDTVSETDKAKMIAIMIKHTTYSETLSRQILDIVDNSPYKTQFSCKTLPDAVQMFNEIKADDTLYNIYTGNIISGASAINSRWFIIECQRTRSGQYSLQLKRDVIADNYDAVLDAPCYIERATIANDSDLIFNSENMQFNQIKQSNDLLQDKFGSYYYVAYMAKGITDAQKSIVIPAQNVKIVEYADPNQFYYGLDKDNSICVNFYRTTDFDIFVDCELIPMTIRVRGDKVYCKEYYDITTSTIYKLIHFIGNRPNTSSYLAAVASALTADIVNLKTKIYEQVTAQLEGTYKYATDTDFTAVQNIIGQNVHDNWLYSGTQNNAYFKYDELKTAETGLASAGHNIAHSEGIITYLQNKLIAVATTLGYTAVAHDSGNANFRTVNVSRFYLYRDNVTTTIGVTVTLIPDKLPVDAPYSILIIPDHIDVAAGTAFDVRTTVRINKYYQEAFVKALTIQGTSQEWLYDIQRLPYSYLSTSNVKRSVYNAILVGSGDNTDPNVITDIGTGAGCVSALTKVFAYYSPTKQISFNINKNISVDNLKISNECDRYRIVSPNGQGMFEFSAAKNDGVDYFNIDCTLRPISPYIHINPNFKRLYKADYDTYDGLICGGDFSIDTVSEKWLNYASQNKYLAQTFNREIANYDFNAKYDILDQSVGAVSGAASAASTGASAGGPIMGAISSVASAGAGVADTLILVDKIREGKSYKKDLFNYNLRNIKAQPQTLVKTGADDYNNKIWPYLEYYSCTDEEKEALRLKLAYNGMTVNVISTIGKYKLDTISYIQGQIIRLENIDGNCHITAEIANEIAKGVYI